jgi:hypothetical protein
MDPKTAREKIDKLYGYIHPETIKSNRGYKYKVFSSQDNAKKDISQFKTVDIENSYSQVGNTETKEICPFCKGKIVNLCYCGYNDKQCENGHFWYYDREGSLKKGKPH